MKKFILFFCVVLCSFANCDFLVGQTIVYPRKSVSGRDPYALGKVGEKVALARTILDNGKLIPVSIICGNLMIDDSGGNRIDISYEYLYKDRFKLSKKIKIKKMTDEHFGPYPFKIDDEITGEVFIHVVSASEVIVAVVSGGQQAEYKFRPDFVFR